MIQTLNNDSLDRLGILKQCRVRQVLYDNCIRTTVTSAGLRALRESIEDSAWHALGWAAAPLRARVMGVTSKPLQYSHNIVNGVAWK